MDFEAYPTAQFPGQLLDGDFSSVAHDDDTDADTEIDILELWKPLTNLILKTTRDACEKSPHFDSNSPSTFQSYWSRVFSDLLDSVVENQDIPEYLTDPPVKGFDVHFFDQNGSCCPCSLPSAPQNIKIFRPNGVTKRDLVEAVGTYLYGGELPRVYALDDGKPVQDKGVMVYTADWMSQRTKDGRATAFPCYFARGHQIVSIYMYCCSKDEHAENVARVEAEREAARKRYEEAQRKVEQSRRKQLDSRKAGE